MIQGLSFRYALIGLAGLVATGSPGGVAPSPPDAPPPAEASGSFAPAGPPSRPPTKVHTGRGCTIDLRQPYTISGTLTGTLDIDYRILVHGPCERAEPGVFDEEWIARGTFTGRIRGEAASASFSYTARVRAGGDVEGAIVLGQGAEGELRVRGNFGDGELSYEGTVH
jgi:hypothetical protein